MYNRVGFNDYPEREYGQVAGSAELDMQRFWSKTRSGTDGCIEWTAAKKSYGYGVFNRDGKHTILAHRMAWILEYGNLPDDSVIMHRCDNPGCVNVKHLMIGSHADNVADKIAKGRGNDGMRHGHAKLTDDVIRQIRSLYQAREANQYQLAKRFGISQSVISEVINRKSWDHI